MVILHEVGDSDLNTVVFLTVLEQESLTFLIIPSRTPQLYPREASIMAKVSESDDSCDSCPIHHFRQQGELPAALRRGIGHRGKPEVGESGCSEGPELSERRIPYCWARSFAQSREKVQNRHFCCLQRPATRDVRNAAFSANILLQACIWLSYPVAIQTPVRSVSYARARTVVNPRENETGMTKEQAPGALRRN